MRRVEPTLPACKQLRKGDVLLSFDGTQIGNDGTVAFRSGERINFSYLVSEKQNHEDVRAACCESLFWFRLQVSEHKDTLHRCGFLRTVYSARSSRNLLRVWKLASIGTASRNLLTDMYAGPDPVQLFRMRRPRSSF